MTAPTSTQTAAPDQLMVVLADTLPWRAAASSTAGAGGSRAACCFRRALSRRAGSVPEYLALFDLAHNDIGIVDHLGPTDVCASYRKRLEAGWREPVSAGPPPAILATLTRPANGAPVRELETWYEAHVRGVVTTAGIRGGARYDRIDVRQGNAAPYFAWYELETGDVERVAADLAEVLAVCPAGAIPSGADGTSWLQIDVYAYFTLVSARAG